MSIYRKYKIWKMYESDIELSKDDLEKCLLLDVFISKDNLEKCELLDDFITDIKKLKPITSNGYPNSIFYKNDNIIWIHYDCLYRYAYCRYDRIFDFFNNNFYCDTIQEMHDIITIILEEALNIKIYDIEPAIKIYTPHATTGEGFPYPIY